MQYCKVIQMIFHLLEHTVSSKYRHTKLVFEKCFLLNDLVTHLYAFNYLDKRDMVREIHSLTLFMTFNFLRLAINIRIKETHYNKPRAQQNI